MPLPVESSTTHGQVQKPLRISKPGTESHDQSQHLVADPEQNVSNPPINKEEAAKRTP